MQGINKIVEGLADHLSEVRIQVLADEEGWKSIKLFLKDLLSVGV
jgi:hypothetical protein